MLRGRGGLGVARLRVPAARLVPRRRSSTICHLSSGSNLAGVAVVRVSGPAAAAALAGVTRRSRPLEARRATLVGVFDPSTGERLDANALALFFPSPKSFTGEDVAELHVHGNPIVVRDVLRALQRAGARLAEPGEFTRRAFEAGKLDLTQVEALADLLSAQTEAQRRQAVRQMDGALGRLMDGWRREVVAALAHLEAVIDFAEDEADVAEDEIVRAVLPAVASLRRRVAAHLDDGRRGELVREGFRVAIVGPPNAGKSSVLNALARREVAIVTGQPGTTRDVMEAALNLGGHAVVLADTAGLRETGDAVEREGIRRGRKRRQDADLTLLVLDASRVREQLEEMGADEVREVVAGACAVVLNKTDLLEAGGSEAALGQARQLLPAAAVPMLAVSARDDVAPLARELQTRVEARLASAAPSSGDEPAVITRERHRQCLVQCLEHVALCEEHARSDLVLAAEELRQAARCIGRIVGRVDVEELLDVIFSDFCIGK